jgi:flagellar biogenesis protein FliO
MWKKYLLAAVMLLSGMVLEGAPTNLLLNNRTVGTTNSLEADAGNSKPQENVQPVIAAFRVVFSLAAVLGIFYGGVWLYRNRFSGQATGQLGNRLRVLESRYLGNRQGIHVVTYSGKRILIGTSPTGISKVSDLPDLSAEEIGMLYSPQSGATSTEISRGPSNGSFGDILASVTNPLKGKANDQPGS